MFFLRLVVRRRKMRVPRREGSTSTVREWVKGKKWEHKRQTCDFDICLVLGMSFTIHKEKDTKNKSGSGGGDVLLLHLISSMSHIFHLKAYLFVFKFSIWYKKWARNYLVARNGHPRKLCKFEVFLKRL